MSSQAGPPVKRLQQSVLSFANRKLISSAVWGWPPGEGSKFTHSHYFGYWLLQQLVLPYKP